MIENLEAKRKLFEELDRVARPSAILASNTSSISITKLTLLKKMVDAGWLGRKTGRGFYTYG